MAIEKKLFTVEEFDELIARPENRWRRFELFNGAIVELTPAEEHAVMGANIVILDSDDVSA